MDKHNHICSKDGRFATMEDCTRMDKPNTKECTCGGKAFTGDVHAYWCPRFVKNVVPWEKKHKPTPPTQEDSPESIRDYIIGVTLKRVTGNPSKNYEKMYEKSVERIRNLVSSREQKIRERIEGYTCRLSSDAHEDSNGRCHAGAAMQDILEELNK